MERTISTGRCPGSLKKKLFGRGWLLITQLGNAGVGNCSPDDVESAGPRPTAFELGHKGSTGSFTVPTTLMPEIWIKLE